MNPNVPRTNPVEQQQAEEFRFPTPEEDNSETFNPNMEWVNDITPEEDSTFIDNPEEIHVGEAIKENLLSINRKADELIDKGKEKVAKFADSVLKVAVKAGVILGGAKLLKEGFDVAKQGIEKAADFISNTATPAVTETISTIQATTAPAINETISTINTTVSPVLTETANQTQTIVDQGTQFTQTAGNEFVNALPTMAKEAATILAVYEGFNATKEAVKGGLEAAGRTIKAGFSEGVDLLGATGKATANTTKTLLNLGTGIAIHGAAGASALLLEVPAHLAAKATKKALDLASDFEAQVATYAVSTGEIAKRVGSMTSGSSKTEAVSRQLSKLGYEGPAKQLNGFEKAISKAGEIAKKCNETRKVAIEKSIAHKKMSNDMDVAIDKIGGSLSGVLRAKADTYLRAADQAADQAAADLQAQHTKYKASNQFRDIGKATVDIVTKSVDNTKKGSIVYNTAAGIVTLTKNGVAKVVKAAPAIASKASNIGTNALSGVQQFGTNSASNVRQLGTNISNGAQSMKSFYNRLRW